MRSKTFNIALTDDQINWLETDESRGSVISAIKCKLENLGMPAGNKVGRPTKHRDSAMSPDVVSFINMLTPEAYEDLRRFII